MTRPSAWETWRGDAAVWLRAHRLELWIIFGIWAIATVVIFMASVGHVSPRRYQDEFLFWALAKNFAAGDGLTWRGVDQQMRSWLYPVLLAPSFWFSSTIAGAYTAVHLISSMMIVGTIFPAFLMARLFLGRWQATLAAIFAISVPAMNYAGIIGTENLGYMTCTAAFGAMLLAMARPRPRNWALAIVAIGIAVLTRTQFIVLLPILPVSVVLVALMRTPQGRREYFRDQRGLLIACGALFALGGLMFLVQGRGAIGIYGGIFEGMPLELDATIYWLKAFTADVYILAGVIPVIATLAMFGLSENRRDPLVSALLALTLVASVAFIAQVAGFSATNPYDWRGRNIFYERYMFYLGPLFFTGLLVAWRRVSVGSAVISVALATLIVSAFQTDSVLVPFSYDSFSLSFVGMYMKAHPDSVESIGLLLARVTLLLGIVYIVSTLPKERLARGFHWLCVVITLSVLIATQAQTWDYARTFSEQAFESVVKPASFIDQNTDEDVGMIITSTDSPEMYFSTEFWNNRITQAFATDDKPFSSPIMYSPKCEFDWNRSGEILGTGCESVPNAWYMRSDNVVIHFKNETKRVHPTEGFPGLTLMVAEPPARLLSIVDGRNVINAVVQGLLNVKTFLDRPGQIRVKLASSSQPHIVQIGDQPGIRIPANGSRSAIVDVPAEQADSRVSIKTLSGLPDNVVVESVEIRQQGGPWTSIL